MGIDLAEHLLLDRQILEHRLDHEVSLRQVAPLQRRPQARQAGLGDRVPDLAGIGAAVVMVGDALATALQRGGIPVPAARPAGRRRSR